MNIEDTWTNEILYFYKYGMVIATDQTEDRIVSCLVLKGRPFRVFDCGNAIRFDSDCF